jgi:hypothetical protein
MHICERVATGVARPGDEGASYAFNPGEAFAESYRVMIETKGTATGYDWPTVDPSFRPDAQALAALRGDVLHPWADPVATTIKGRFAARSRAWRRTISTPLDGIMRLSVTVPAGGADNLKLLTSDGRTVLSTGTWSSAGGKSLEYRLCGTRSVQVRIIRGGSSARFALRVVRP